MAQNFYNSKNIYPLKYGEQIFFLLWEKHK